MAQDSDTNRQYELSDDEARIIELLYNGSTIELKKTLPFFNQYVVEQTKEIIEKEIITNLLSNNIIEHWYKESHSLSRIFIKLIDKPNQLI